MTFRGILVGGLFGFALSFGCASAQTAPSPSPTPSPAATPVPATPPKAVVAAPSPVTPVPATPPKAVVAAPSPEPSPASTSVAAPPAIAAPPAANAAAPTPAPAQTGAAAAPGAPIPVEVPAKPKKKPPPPPPPLETALSTDPSPSFQPATFLATSKAAERYAAIVAGGRLADRHPGVAPGRHRRGRREIAQAPCASKAISTRRRRSMAPPPRSGARELTAAVKRFQARMGLRKTGIVAGATLKAINVPAEVRHTELAASAPRLSPNRQFRVRRPLRRRQSAVDLGRGGRERRASRIATSPSSAIPTTPRRRSPRISR